MRQFNIDESLLIGNSHFYLAEGVSSIKFSFNKRNRLVKFMNYNLEVDFIIQLITLYLIVVY